MSNPSCAQCRLRQQKNFSAAKPPPYETMMQILDDERKRVSLDLHDSVQNELRLLRDKYRGIHEFNFLIVCRNWTCI